MDMKTKMLMKIKSENLLPKGSGGDKPSLDHKVFLHFFLTKERANVPKYIFKHLIKSLEDSCHTPIFDLRSYVHTLSD